jgi:hypothetical protein
MVLQSDPVSDALSPRANSIAYCPNLPQARASLAGAFGFLTLSQCGDPSLAQRN